MENQNIIEEIAKMKSVELGEPFILGSDGEPSIKNNPYQFGKEGLFDCNYDECNYMLIELIKGNKTIKRRFWKPKKLETYWYVDISGEEAFAYFSDESLLDVMNYKLGNCFRTAVELADNKKSILSMLKSDELFK